MSVFFGVPRAALEPQSTIKHYWGYGRSEKLTFPSNPVPWLSIGEATPPLLSIPPEYPLSLSYKNQSVNVV